MKMSLAHGHDIERHHARKHVVIRQRIAQHSDIASAVLQADDRGGPCRMLRDQLRDFGRVIAFDGDEDDIGITQNRRIAGKRNLR